MATAKFDAVVIGAGHNGLVNAAYLARAGKRVLVLEKREVIGGATVTEEIVPGFKFSVFSYVVSLLRPEIIEELELPKHGLQLLALDGTFTPLPDGRYLARWHDAEKTRQEIAKFSRKDADAYSRFGLHMHHMARAVRDLLMMRPPEPSSMRPSDLAGLNRLAQHFRGLGNRRLYDLVRLMTASATDYLDRWFECDPLKATMSASGIIGTFLSPRSPGSAYVLLHHYMGEIDGVSRSWGFARGGMGAVSGSLASAARSLGAEIRTEAGVAKIVSKNGRATGVVLESGEEIEASQIASSLDPKRTFLKLIDESALPSDFVADVRRFKIRGSSGKVNLALSELPDFTCLPGDGPHLRGSISISPSMDYIERAYDEAKYGTFSSHPYLDILIPSTIDPSMAPPGKHVMSIFVQYAPYDIKGATWEEKREAFGDAVVDTLSEYAPNLRRAIVGRQVVSPWDMERTIGLTEGNIFHGELTLDQLFFLRPVAGWAQFKTPLEGLYLAGSGAHPGGGVMGAPGKLAAVEMLKAAS
ncbi:MAG TPA: NAD(P)/FAD-dependent oxidoreductase [Vicinamibacteria bacterium]|nr:NAD(P)/FAD-dependent oxidoreductase [Vicinamibacteria bacterium]